MWCANAATEGKGSEPAEGERGQPGAREAQRRPGERAPKKPHASAEAVLGQKIHSPPGLGGLSEQARLPETAVGQESSRRGRWAALQDMHVWFCMGNGSHLAEQRRDKEGLSALLLDCCRTEREIYHPPVQEAAGPSQVCQSPCLELPHQQAYIKTANSLIPRP